jgi:hypothetical protein
MPMVTPRQITDVTADADRFQSREFLLGKVLLA